jgi:hypothetical protein
MCGDGESDEMCWEFRGYYEGVGVTDCGDRECDNNL